MAGNRQITNQEITEALDIPLGCVSNISNDKLHYSKVSARWIPHILVQKKRREGVHTQNLSHEAMTTLTQGVSLKSLVKKYGCTTMNPEKTHSTERGCQKEESHLKSQREINLRRRYCTQHSSAAVVS